MSVAVSVIVCTWNRAGLLDQTLARMRSLRVPAGLSWELLVVNNNCTDPTDAVIADHRKGPLPVRRLFQPRPGKCHAANLALDEAAGELLLWTDDDVVVDPGWLESVVEGARAFPHAAGFGGPIDPWFPVEPDPVLMDVFEPLKMGFCGLDLGPAAREMAAAEQAFGANMAFRAPAVGRLRFDPNLGRVGHLLGGHEEKDFQDRLRAAGGAVVWLPGMRVKHYVDPDRMTPAYMGRYYFGTGVTDTRRTGAPAGPTLFGAPRYLYRLCAGQYLGYLRSRLGGDRKAALERLRSYHYHRGVIRGCRDLSRGPVAVPVGGGP
jgi:glycosyltransferase involved in cell wall biosynthesis